MIFCHKNEKEITLGADSAQENRGSRAKVSDQYMAENPEEFLDYCDWMGIPMQGISIPLDRFKRLLTEALTTLNS